MFLRFEEEKDSKTKIALLLIWRSLQKLATHTQKSYTQLTTNPSSETKNP